MKMTILFTLILSIFAVSACQTASTEKASNVPASAAQNEIKQISVEQAKDAIGAKDTQFIDVRTTGEYAGGHAPKAANFPLDALNKDLAKLDKDQPVYVICQTGKRSQKGAEILQKAGFKSIYNINGGTSAWESAGFPTEK
ncbi:MAG: rhodanese-like domain-containing protein [Pyrinomonadaceae bacterium]|nr:rhodanese-like domain-containing protein [Pyrinomonadaceae bacterium]